MMSVHVGLHANMMMNAMRKVTRITKPSKARTILLKSAAILLCAYGIYAFVHRQLGSYMFLIKQFVFFDFSEPLVFFFADYIAIMGMFICVGHYISDMLRKLPARQAATENNII